MEKSGKQRYSFLYYRVRCRLCRSGGRYRCRQKTTVCAAVKSRLHFLATAEQRAPVASRPAAQNRSPPSLAPPALSGSRCFRGCSCLISRWTWFSNSSSLLDALYAAGRPPNRAVTAPCRRIQRQSLTFPRIDDTAGRNHQQIFAGRYSCQTTTTKICDMMLVQRRVCQQQTKRVLAKVRPFQAIT